MLGALELAVLDRLWEAGPSDVRRMHAFVGEARGISPNTVQSTLERLHRKGFADRRKIGRGYAYTARFTRSEWLGRAVGELLDALPRAAELPLAAFVDLAERAGAEQLDALERLVRERRRRREEPP
jgi:predicted transcriptional regulator